MSLICAEDVLWMPGIAASIKVLSLELERIAEVDRGAHSWAAHSSNSPGQRSDCATTVLHTHARVVTTWCERCHGAAEGNNGGDEESQYMMRYNQFVRDQLGVQRVLKDWNSERL